MFTNKGKHKQTNYVIGISILIKVVCLNREGETDKKQSDKEDDDVENMLENVVKLSEFVYTREQKHYTKVIYYYYYVIICVRERRWWCKACS